MQKIPILSSIIDTKMLKEFEAINEQDEFYQAMMKDSGASVPLDEATENPSLKNIPIPQAIQNILPKKAKIEDMAVQNISPTERLFKVTLDNGAIRYIQVKKENGKYVIAGK